MALPKLKTYGDFDVTSVMMPCGAQLIGNGGFVYLNPDYTAITCMYATRVEEQGRSRANRIVSHS